jgi:hypothetical protein
VKVQPLELRREDISDLSKGQDIERLFRSLNGFGASANQALKSGLTFTDNMQAFVKEIEFYLDSEGEVLTLTSPWTAQDTNCKVWKADGGVVQLEGRVTRNTGTSGSAVCTLSTIYWPHRALYFATAASTALSAEIDVSAAGVVSASWAGTAPTWISLDGAVFNAIDHRPKSNPGMPITFTNELAGKAKPLGCWVWQAWDETDKRNAPVTAGPVAWELSSKGDQIVVRDIANLAHERKYKVRLVVVAG